MKCVKDVLAVFANGRAIAANSIEGFGPRSGAKSAGDFSFDRDHSDIAFGQVIIKGNAKIMHKGQSLGFMVLEPVEQVLGRGLFLATRFGRRMS
jgi:hypothetical protein